MSLTKWQRMKRNEVKCNEFNEVATNETKRSEV